MQRRRPASPQRTPVPAHDDDSCCVSLKDGVKNVFEDVAAAIENAPDALFDGALPPTEVEVVFQMRAIDVEEGSDGVEIGIDLGFLSFDVDTKGDKTIRKREIANTIKFKFACKKKKTPAVEDDVLPLDRADVPQQVGGEREVRRGGQA